MLMEFKEIFYHYESNQKATLNGLSLQIKQGKKYALIGQNGCGKTTLLRLGNGLYLPQKGEIFWQEKLVKYDRISLSNLRQKIGLVFQDPEQQLVATTVEEDLSYGLCNLGLPDDIIAQKVRETLIDFELEELAHTPIHHLSLGQKKRVAIADVMIMNPELLLLDEPTAYLDPKQLKNLKKMLEKIAQKGTTILIATHDLKLVNEWAQWVFVMDQGKLIMENEPDLIFQESKILEKIGLADFCY